MSTRNFSGIKSSILRTEYPVISFSYFLTVSLITMKLISKDDSSLQNDQSLEV